MVLPVAEGLTTPHLTSSMNPVLQRKFKERYRSWKGYFLKGTWGVVTGAGLMELATEVVTEVVKGETLKHGKKKVGSLILLGCTHIGLSAVPMITNSTRIIKLVKTAHSITSGIYRCAHDASEVPLIALDFILFGEYVPSCPPDGYQLLNVSSDALDQFANLDKHFKD
jgi:hypothetical protein